MITVKDIREKEFGKQKHGYHEDEVDDFLDEIADQMEALIKENRSLLTQLDEAKAAAIAFPEAPAPQAVYEPPVVTAPARDEHAVDEPSYFKNLETTLRDTLLSAQRVADNTVAEARVKARDLINGAEEQAKQLVTGAQEQAQKMTDDAQSALQSAKAKLENFKKQHEDYRSRAVHMIKEQMAALKIDEEEVVQKMEHKAQHKAAPAKSEQTKIDTGDKPAD